MGCKASEYHAEAKKLRGAAEATENQITSATLLKLAEEYERMARYPTETPPKLLPKIEARRQHVLDAIARAPDSPLAWPRCHCGAPAVYEVNRRSGVTFVCAKHVPEGL
jgi:hypothetical protein